MNVVIGVADCHVTKDPTSVLITYALGSCIGVAIHDNRILAAHFSDDALNPFLAGLRFGRQFVNAQAHITRSGEGDEARFGMLDEWIANRRPAAGRFCRQLDAPRPKRDEIRLS